MSERFEGEHQKLFAWPLFMVAQVTVLGKNYSRFRTTLENPDIDESKAFEAAVQLAVLVRLSTKQHHNFVPPHPNIGEIESAFAATLQQVIDEVEGQYSDSPSVVQVVAVPMFASFPTYDFFLLNKVEQSWIVAAGYQCKQCTQDITEHSKA
jgi:hypothetical protein